MAIEYTLTGEARDDQGKGASRRLRRQGKVPAILYGGDQAPQALAISHNELDQKLAYDSFYSRVIDVLVGKKKHPAVLKDLQRHPAKNQILHLDLQRVRAGEALRVHLPLHFVNGETAPGVKQAGGVVSHHLTSVEISCLPKDLPDAIEVDLGALELGQSVHLSELNVPEGVSIVALSHGDEHDKGQDVQVASVHQVRATVEADDEADDAEGEQAADDADAGDSGE